MLLNIIIIISAILNGSIFLSPLTLGPFLEIGEERDHCPGREITSRPDLSLGLVGKIFNDLSHLRACVHNILKTEKGLLSY